MNLDWKRVIAGAVSGFVAAFVVDVNAWAKSNAKFDVALAVKRWISGAVSGGAAALGFGGLA